MIRLFCAIAAPEELSEELLHRLRDLPGARWRTPDDWHITLRFFGEIDERRADDLDLELSKIGGGPFELSLRGVGVFGEGDQIGSLHAVVTGRQELDILQQRCESAARRAGLKPDTRKYAPHLTLAYLNRQTPPEKTAQWIARNNLLHSKPFWVERFGLYSSWRGSDGSHYQLERAYRL